jgi:tetratricopeptide (TPR) repeat protein
MENNVLLAAQAAAERLQHQGKLSEAIALLEPLVRPPFTSLSEPLGDAVFTLSSLYLLTEQWREGERLLETALPLAAATQRTDLHRCRSQFYDARGHHKKAATERQHAAEAETSLDDAGVRAFSRALRLSAEHDPEATYQAALEALEQLPKDRAVIPLVLSIAAFSAFDAGRDEDVVGLAGKLLTHTHSRPDEHAVALQLKGMRHRLRGEHALSLERFQEATYLVRQGADWQTATELTGEIARSLLVLGQVRAAEQLIEALLEHFPYRAEAAHSFLVVSACLRGELALAQERLQSAEASTKSRSRLAEARTALALETQSFPEALTYLNEQRRGCGGIAALRVRVSRVPVLWQVGKQEEALKEQEELTALSSESLSRELQAGLRRMEARLAYLIEDWSSGVAAWKHVLRLEPYPVNLPESWTLLGDGYVAQGEAAAARFAWERAAAQPVESVWVRRAKERLETSP